MKISHKILASILNVYLKNLLLFLFLNFILIFICKNASSSAWIRKEKEGLIIFESLIENNKYSNLFNNLKSHDYKVNSYKLYFEYGLLNLISIGGYLKNYNFESRYYDYDFYLAKKVNNDYYSNIFLLHNIYNNSKNIVSIQYSFYFPITYNEDSEDINFLDTQYALEFAILYGKDGNINIGNSFLSHLNYFIDLSLNYKFFNKFSYDEIKLKSTIGFRYNSSSYTAITYEHKNYLKTKSINEDTLNINIYNSVNTSNQLKLSFIYKFLDNLMTEFSFYKTVSHVNSSGIIFSFIFDIY